MTFTLGARGLSSSIKSVGCFYAPKAYPPLLGRVPGGAFVRSPESRTVAIRSFQTTSPAGGSNMAISKNKPTPPLPGSLVSPSWLSSNITAPGLVILDASWFMPNAGRNGRQEYLADRIPGSRFFDIDTVSDPSIPLPHMLPRPEVFGRACDALGITNDSTVVVYDRLGIFSAPRVWWMFRAFGHRNVAVLDGGMPAWRDHTKERTALLDCSVLEASEAFGALDAAVTASGEPLYSAKLDPKAVASMDQVLSSLGKAGTQLVDARSGGRFNGTEPEPRPGLRPGHIPGAVNVPFDTLLMHSGAMRKLDDLRGMFASARIDLSSPITVSCGTGITACVVGLALDLAGASQVSIYDGSWCEWGAEGQSTPVMRGTPTGSVLGTCVE